MKAVFDEATAVVFELDLQNPDVIDRLMRCKNLDGDKRLDELIPTEIYGRLKACFFLFFSFNFTLKSNKFNLIIRHAPIQTESPSLGATRKSQAKCGRSKSRSQTPFHEPCWQVNLAYISTLYPDFFPKKGKKDKRLKRGWKLARKGFGLTSE